MRITSVSYTRLKSFGHYENETIGGTAEVEVGDDPEAVLTTLQAFVEQQLQVLERHQEVQSDLQMLESKRRHLERAVDTMHQRWELGKAFLERFGVQVDEFLDDGVPF